MSFTRSSTNYPNFLAIFYTIHPLLYTQIIIFETPNEVNRNAPTHFYTSVITHRLIILIFYWCPSISLSSSCYQSYPYHFSL